MDDLTFEWDFNKSASNNKKHGISFNEATTVFSDPFARLIIDPEHSVEEQRFILLGESNASRLLVVCHCIRVNESLRIISTRKANRQEHKIYEGFRYA